MMMNPNPRKYYFNHFGYFPAARFSRNDDAAAFKEFVLRDDSPPGITSAIAFQAFEIVILSDEGAFVVYGKRADELGVIGIFRAPFENRPEPLFEHLGEIIMDCEMAYQEIRNFKPSIAKAEFLDAWRCAQIGER